MGMNSIWKLINKHNQKLINILESQKIYESFLKNTDKVSCKWVLESETRKISFLRKPA